MAKVSRRCTSWTAEEIYNFALYTFALILYDLFLIVCQYCCPSYLLHLFVRGRIILSKLFSKNDCSRTEISLSPVNGVLADCKFGKSESQGGSLNGKSALAIRSNSKKPVEWATGIPWPGFLRFDRDVRNHSDGQDVLGNVLNIVAPVANKRQKMATEWKRETSLFFQGLGMYGLLFPRRVRKPNFL